MQGRATCYDRVHIAGAVYLPRQVQLQALRAGACEAIQLLNVSHLNVLVHDIGDGATLGAMQPLGSTHIVFLDAPVICRWAKRPWNSEAVSEFGHRRPHSWRVRPRKRMTLVEAFAHILTHEVAHVAQEEQGRASFLGHLSREDEAQALALAHGWRVAKAMKAGVATQ